MLQSKNPVRNDAIAMNNDCHDEDMMVTRYVQCALKDERAKTVNNFFGGTVFPLFIIGAGPHSLPL